MAYIPVFKTHFLPSLFHCLSQQEQKSAWIHMDNLLKSHCQHFLSLFLKKLFLWWKSRWCSATWAAPVIHFKEDGLRLWAYFLVGVQTAANKQETLVEECGHATRTAGQMRVLKHDPNWWIMGGVTFSCESVTYCPDQTPIYIHTVLHMLKAPHKDNLSRVKDRL